MERGDATKSLFYTLHACMIKDELTRKQQALLLSNTYGWAATGIEWLAVGGLIWSEGGVVLASRTT